MIREITGRAFESGEGGGSLHQHLEAFHNVLLHDLTPAQFATVDRHGGWPVS